MSLDFISVNFDKKNKNQNNQDDRGIYFCELTRTISKINIKESQICHDSDLNYLNKKPHNKYKSSTNVKDSNFSKNICLETKKSDLFDAEIDVSITTSVYDHLKKLSFRGKTIITRVPKFNTTNYKTVFEIETGSNSGLETVTEVIYNGSVNDQFNKVKKSISITGKQKITINNINLLVEPITFFENNLFEISKLGNIECDFQTVFNEDKTTDFQTVNRFLESFVKTDIVKSEQTMIISKLFGNGEYLEFDSENLIQRTTIQRDAIEVLMKESYETSTLEISTKAGDIFLSNENDDSEHCFKSSKRSNKTTCKNVITYPDFSDSSSDYETCSSMHLKWKITKYSDERKNKLTNNKSTERNINSCQCSSKDLSLQKEVPKTIDKENDETLDYYSLESLEISIPVPQYKSINYLKTRNSLLYDDEFLMDEISINKLEFRNSSCAESNWSDFLFVNDKYTPNDFLTEDSSTKNFKNDLDLKKKIIDKSLEQITYQSTEYTISKKNLITSNNRIVYFPSKFSNIISQAWNTMKTLSSCVFYIGSYINCNNSSITRAILKFYQNENEFKRNGKFHS